jgi:hypothetical protein
LISAPAGYVAGAREGDEVVIEGGGAGGGGVLWVGGSVLIGFGWEDGAGKGEVKRKGGREGGCGEVEREETEGREAESWIGEKGSDGTYERAYDTLIWSEGQPGFFEISGCDGAIVAVRAAGPGVASVAELGEGEVLAA